MNKMRISPKRQNKKESDSGAEDYNNWIRKKLTTTGNLIREKTHLGELLILSIITSEVFWYYQVRDKNEKWRELKGLVGT